MSRSNSAPRPRPPIRMTRPPFHVFVVEDHAGTARGLKVFLELAGYVVTIASDMRSALQIAKTSRFDVLVSDLNLPDGTGWQLMEDLRKVKPVPGIVFSAFDEPEHLARSKAAGFDEHVVKGTTPETLLAAIDRLARFKLPALETKAPDATTFADAACAKKSATRAAVRRSVTKRKSRKAAMPS